MGGTGGTGGDGGGVVLLVARGTLVLGPNAVIDVSQGGRTSGESGFSGKLGGAGASGGAGSSGYYGSAGSGGYLGGRGGNGGSGGTGGRGGNGNVGGNGGDGGWGAPGTVKLHASAIFADAGTRFVADNGNGDSDAARLGRMTFISNLSQGKLGNLQTLCGDAFVCGSIDNDMILRGGASYAGAQDIPLLGQLASGEAAVEGFIANGNRSWLLAKASGTASQGPDGSREYCLKGLFKDFDQYFIENPTGDTLPGREMDIHALTVRVPEIPAGSVWTTTVPHEETLPYSTARLEDGTIISIPNLWFETVLKFPSAPGGNGNGTFNGIGLEQSPGTDYEGKTWPDGKPVYVWQDYVAGTDPRDSSDLFRCDLKFLNGIPTPVPVPNLGTNRTYVIDGKPSLSDPWGVPDDSSRFFRIRVEMPSNATP